MPFQHQRRVVVRVYRPRFQWPMYGATPARTQAHPTIRLRPPFRVVWSRGLGSLIEFPAVVSDGVAYIGNNHGTRAGALDAGRHGRSGGATRAGKMAASPAVVGAIWSSTGWTARPRARPRRRALRLAFRVGSPIESSPLVRDRHRLLRRLDGNVYALDLRTRRLRWVFRSGYKITSSAALAGRTLYIGDYGGRLLALAPGAGGCAGPAGVNGRIYGTPAVWGGRVFVPSSDGGSLTAFSHPGALPLAGAHRRATSTRRRRSGTGGSTSARTTAGSTASRRAPAASTGRWRPAGRSPAHPWSWTALRTPAASRTGSSASTGAAAASCSASRTASTCRCRAAAAGCSCTATRASTRSSPSGRVRNDPCG